ncbi:glycosyltransferase [Actibacterium lipolyticum]|uniref:Putative glycosyltransferase YkoT n=1 Tax=Actibacterium lipolyticum TaxID=1524263 RepID=A0A238JMJ4_9RHOB|nr:glycosyltransferase [Actibacterium lipolyticum]SMX31102.1 putative glycosyltransferase YkoT [Actibacterium lipolyticum]
MTIVSSNFDADPMFPVACNTPAPITIVVPCYNEASRLDAAAFQTYIDTRNDVSFLFVDDGSRDDTLECLSTLQATRPHRITVLSLSQNSGKAEAVRQGLIFATNAGAQLVGYWDADLATPLDAIDDFVRVANKFQDVSVVFGSRRALLGHRIERTLKRRMVSRLCAVLARQAVRLPLGDTQCGAKLLRNTGDLRDALKSPFTAGWLFDVELFARLSARMPKGRCAFYEQPLCEWDEIPGSKVSGSAIVKSGMRMLRLIAETRFGLPALQNEMQAVPVARVVDAPKTPTFGWVN